MTYAIFVITLVCGLLTMNSPKPPYLQDEYLLYQAGSCLIWTSGSPISIESTHRRSYCSTGGFLVWNSCGVVELNQLGTFSFSSFCNRPLTHEEYMGNLYKSALVVCAAIASAVIGAHGLQVYADSLFLTMSERAAAKSRGIAPGATAPSGSPVGDVADDDN